MRAGEAPGGDNEDETLSFQYLVIPPKSPSAAPQSPSLTSATPKSPPKSPPMTPTARNSGSTPKSAKIDPATARKLERTRIADSLNHQLETRHVDKTMMHSNVAPSLRAAQKRLEHNVTRDHVGRLLGARPDAEMLSHRGITQPAGQAGRIQSAAKRLERNFTSNRIAHLLEHRALAEDLQHKDILGRQNVASSIQRPQRDLQKNLAKSSLYHALKVRPSIKELMKKGVYPSPTDEDACCVGMSDKSGEDGDSEEESSEQSSREPVELESVIHAFHREYADSRLQELYPLKRSQYFHLTRVLLQHVAGMAEAGELSSSQKGLLKDLIMDLDPVILAVAETFDSGNDLADFKDSIIRLAKRRELSMATV